MKRAAAKVQLPSDNIKWVGPAFSTDPAVRETKPQKAPDIAAHQASTHGDIIEKPHIQRKHQWRFTGFLQSSENISNNITVARVSGMSKSA
ncbi:hypothetical protein Nepgr_026465 [Nepenthes gracilis]|uniref:Uncharacterized protein n=1 Tax=Nepenthes gracilis TaxID=150966 RepID=A0AAD3T8B1_NEPGR|nr:hypothetical protein Nepgr_026465 [Nepenthes gracilis]